MSNFLVIFNNSSGRGIKRYYKEIIFNKLRSIPCEFKFINISNLNCLKSFNKYDTIIVVGGDGSLLKVLPLIVNTNKKLGIIPCGTANLFAAGLGIPKNIKKALEIIISGNTMEADLGMAGNKYFSLRVGMGYDAEIINNSSSGLKKKLGYLAYFINGVISSFNLSIKDYKLKIDETDIAVKANSIIIANSGNMFRKIFTVAPKGSVNDGELDIFILKTKNLLDFIKILFQIILNRHKTNSSVIYNKAKSIKIETGEKNFHIDGEVLAEVPIDIKVIPKAINVLVPSN